MVGIVSDEEKKDNQVLLSRESAWWLGTMSQMGHSFLSAAASPRVGAWGDKFNESFTYVVDPQETARVWFPYGPAVKRRPLGPGLLQASPRPKQAVLRGIPHQ